MTDDELRAAYMAGAPGALAWPWPEGLRAVLATFGAPPSRCPYCDGTGDVHTPTGEWRGRCTCEAGKDAPVPVAQPDSVTSIMLDVVPGPDGMGIEVYAKTAADVQRKLSEMGQRIEELESRAAPAPVAMCHGCGMPQCRDAGRCAWVTPSTAPAAQPAGEHVAWVPIHPRHGPLWSMATSSPSPDRLPQAYPLRAVLALRKPLTDEQIDTICNAEWDNGNGTMRKLARAIERAHGITS